MKRRSRFSDDNAQYNLASYVYLVRVFYDGNLVGTPICIKAFMYLNGISVKRVQALRESLSTMNIVPIDKRGKHKSSQKAFR